MRPLKTILVCLDLTEMDDFLIRHALHLCEQVEDIEKIYFAHNIRFEDADDAQDLLDQLDKPLRVIVEDTLDEAIQTHFATVVDPPAYEILVREESSSPAALAELADSHQAGLVVVGKKIAFKGSGMAVVKLLRILPAHTSLLLVPETSRPQIRNILAPVDFSKASKVATEMAAYLRRQTGAELHCQHVFSIPSFYFPSIMVNDLEPSMRQEAQKRWREFAKGLHQVGAIDLDCTFSFNSDTSISQTITDHANMTHQDLIVVGSKGRGGLAAFVIGSVALQLVQAELPIPLLVV